MIREKEYPPDNLCLFTLSVLLLMALIAFIGSQIQEHYDAKRKADQAFTVISENKYGSNEYSIIRDNATGKDYIVAKTDDGWGYVGSTSISICPREEAESEANK